MCIVIYKQAGKMVDTNVLYQCWENNPDGAGFVFPADNGQLEMRKGYMKWKDFKKAWKSVKSALLDRPVVIHFRIATHGMVNPANTHPFWIEEGRCALAHNGILTGTGAVYGNGGAKTDTQMFADNYLAPLYRQYPDCFEHEAVVQLLNKVCGSSKLAIMHNMGKVTLINERDGVWEEDIWYSNNGYKKRPAVVLYTGGYHQSYRSGGYFNNKDKEWVSKWKWVDDHYEDFSTLQRELDEEENERDLIPSGDLFYCLECNEWFTGKDVHGRDIDNATCPHCRDWVYHESAVFYCAVCKEYGLFDVCEHCMMDTHPVTAMLVDGKAKGKE